MLELMLGAVDKTYDEQVEMPRCMSSVTCSARQMIAFLCSVSIVV